MYSVEMGKMEHKVKKQVRRTRINSAIIKTIASGVDFLGWVHFSDHLVLRTATKRRMLRRLKETPILETIQSYLGLLKHGNTHKLKRRAVFTCL